MKSNSMLRTATALLGVVALGGCSAGQMAAIGGSALSALPPLIDGNTKDAAKVFASSAATAWTAATIADYESERRRSAAEEAKQYGYKPSEGTRVEIRDIALTPTAVRRGQKVQVALDYALLAPSDLEAIPVEESFELFKGDTKLFDVKQPKTRKEPGGWTSTAEFEIPADAPKGTYTLRSKVTAGLKDGVGEAQFKVG